MEKDLKRYNQLKSKTYKELLKLTIIELIDYQTELNVEKNRAKVIADYKMLLKEEK